MPNDFNGRVPWIMVALTLAIFVLAALLGGPGAVADADMIRLLATERASHLTLAQVAIALTNSGGAAGMISILLVAVAVLLLQRRWKLALWFGFVVLGGRAVVEMLKLAIARPRPDFGPYPVRVSSLSFPSAHAANSMITFLTIAVILPARFRVLAVAAAVCLSGVIGVTRPFLGVHWPSDVVGGWAFGIAWVTMLTRASGYWPASRGIRTI